MDFKSNNINNNNQLPGQIDSSQFLVELQLNIIYCLESILSMIKSWFKHLFKSYLNFLYQIYLNSIFYQLFYTIKTYSLNNKTRRTRLMEWIRKKLPTPPFTPNNFNTDWRDGIRLCALCESIAPGCCPRYDLLNPSYCVNNLKLALCLIKNNLNIQPDITEKEIYECKSEAKLVHLLSQMKVVNTKLLLRSASSKIKSSKNLFTNLELVNDDSQKASKERQYFESFESFFDRCSVRGMGTCLGVRSRRSRFTIHYGLYPPEFVFIIEIVGPNDSFCSERIEINYGENLNNLNMAWQFYQDEVSQNLTMRAAMKVKSDKIGLKIPFFCELMEDHVLITYIPLFAGEHRISIIWQGRHIIGSPYYAMIEETEYLQQDLHSIGPKFTPGLQYPLCLLNTDQDFEPYEVGTVVRKKTLKKSIIIKNKAYDYYSYIEKQQKMAEQKLNKLSESKSNSTEQQDNNNNNNNEEMKSFDDNRQTFSDSSRTSSIQSAETEHSIQQTNKTNFIVQTIPDQNQITNNEQKQDSLSAAESFEDDQNDEKGQTDCPAESSTVFTEPIAIQANTLPVKSVTHKKLRLNKSFNTSLKKMLTDNNESFTKEFNLMAKNLKEKLKRNKKE